MAFSHATVLQAWTRADGACECRRRTHGHPYVRCGKELVWANRGRSSGRGAWEAHHSSATGGDGLANCQILCWDCHSATF